MSAADPFSDMFGMRPPSPAPPAKKPAERGVRIHARSIDGVSYVRAEDIADLKVNQVLPGIEAKLRGRR